MLSFFFFLLLLLSPPTAAATPPQSKITLTGAAVIKNKAILLTEDVSCPPPWSPPIAAVGAATSIFHYKNSTPSFSSSFSFSISSDCPFSSHGLSFLISAAAITTTPFLAVEFDPSSNNAAVVTSSSSISAAAMLAGVDLRSGEDISAWVIYSYLSKTVSLYLSYSSSTRPFLPLLRSSLDLSSLLIPAHLHLRFSASGGAYSIKKWRLIPLAAAYDGGDDAGECMICFPSMEEEKKSFFKWVLLGVVGIVVVGVVVVVMAVGGRRRRKKRRRKGGVEEMRMEEVRRVTGGFDRRRVIGEGGTARVYAGVMRTTGEEVAVKRFKRAEDGGAYFTELVTVVGCLRHRNVVRLEGWCCEGGEMVLVYEFMKNGCLRRAIDGGEWGTVLEWGRRVCILDGVAAALAFLHEECERQVIHRDVKSSNIMLDEHYNAKLGDFGLAQVHDHGRSTKAVVTPAGTLGYLAPEYAQSGIATVKTDMYSFGVVVLEVATGRPAVDRDGRALTDWVWSLWDKDQLAAGADPRLCGRFDPTEMDLVMKIGLSCVNRNARRRPAAREVRRMMKGEAPPPPIRRRRRAGRLAGAEMGESEELGCGSRGAVWRISVDSSSWLTPDTHFSRE